MASIDTQEKFPYLEINTDGGEIGETVINVHKSAKRSLKRDPTSPCILKILTSDYVPSLIAIYIMLPI